MKESTNAGKQQKIKKEKKQPKSKKNESLKLAREMIILREQHRTVEKIFHPVED